MAKRRSPTTPRDNSGRFAKGASGNPGGRPKGTRSPPKDTVEKIAIKQGGTTKFVDPKALIMKKLAHAALSNDDTDAARLYLREARLKARQEANAAPQAPPRPRSRGQSLYYEQALLALGVLKVDAFGHLVIPRNVFADLDRLYASGGYDAQGWKALQIALDSPKVLGVRYPGRRCVITTELQARRARSAEIEKSFAEFDEIVARARAEHRESGVRRRSRGR